MTMTRPAPTSTDVGHRPALRGRGCWVDGDDGRSLFDVTSGMGRVNIGHGRDEVLRAAVDQMASSADTTPSTIVAERLAGLVPAATVRLVPDAQSAIAAAVDVARALHRANGEPDRLEVVTHLRSDHGALLPGAIRVQGPDQYRSPFLQPGVGHDLECAREVERAILAEGPGTVAAVVAEPISVAAGVHLPHPSHWPMLRTVCDRNGVVLIADETVTGLGRTGAPLTTEHWGVMPDITAVANGLTAGYASLGAVIAVGGSASVMDDLGPVLDVDAVSCAVAASVLDVTGREDLVARSRREGLHLLDRLHELHRHSMVGQVRGGLGLLAGVELVCDRSSRSRFPVTDHVGQRVTAAMARHGLLGRAGNVVVVAPPLCATRQEVDFLVDALDAAIGEVDDELGAPA